MKILPTPPPSRQVPGCLLTILIALAGIIVLAMLTGCGSAGSANNTFTLEDYDLDTCQDEAGGPEAPCNPVTGEVYRIPLLTIGNGVDTVSEDQGDISISSGGHVVVALELVNFLDSTVRVYIRTFVNIDGCAPTGGGSYPFDVGGRTLYYLGAIGSSIQDCATRGPQEITIKLYNGSHLGLEDIDKQDYQNDEVLDTALVLFNVVD